VRKTSGDIFFGKFGFEVGKGKLSLSANAVLPLSQNRTGGTAVANYR
jgi:hypothetical protein